MSRLPRAADIMAGRKPSGLTVVMAAAILIAAALLFWFLGRETLEETRT